ncbi:MAG: hypothetical protein WCH83_12165 [Alphaproteobacteria bacterium]|jgi:hypothetical protein
MTKTHRLSLTTASTLAAIMVSAACLMPLSSANAASAKAPGAATAATEAPALLEMQRWRRGGPGWRGRRGGGWVGPAVGLGAAGLIIGGIAAANARPAYGYDRECWVERRWVEGPYGMERRRVRVCE